MTVIHKILLLFILLSCEQTVNQVKQPVKKEVEDNRIASRPETLDTQNIQHDISQLKNSGKRSEAKSKIPHKEVELVAEQKPIHHYVDEPAVITAKYRIVGDSIEFIYTDDDPGNPAIGGSSTIERSVLSVKNVKDSFLFNTSSLKETSFSNEFTGEIYGTYGSELLSGTIQGTRNKDNTWSVSVDVKMNIFELTSETKKVKSVKFISVFTPL